MTFEYRPLPPIWPFGERSEATRARFKAAYANTIELLRRELWHLETEEPIVVEAGFKPHEIRLDGMPRAGAKPSDPAIILSFASKFGPLRYGCDRFYPHEANLRAIALGLEALRTVDRYGITKRGEQYRGWAALPAPGETSSYEAAARTIRDLSGIPPAGVGPGPTLREAYRAAAKRVHPDVGGRREDWLELERARQVVGL